MNPDLRERMSAADPADATSGLSPERGMRLIDQIVADDVPTPATARTARPTRQRIVRSALLLSTAAAVVGLVATRGQDPLPPGVVVPPALSSAGPADPDPGAVRLELRKLAADATGQLTPGRYLYTSTRSRNLVVSEGVGRYWQTEVEQRWTGTSCQDRSTVTVQPATFPTAQDAYAVEAQRQAWAAEVLDGWTRTFRGPQLWDTGDRPCQRSGTFDQPNPSYIAGYPVTPDAFLAKVRTDSASTAPTGSDDTLMDDVVLVLRSPWLSDAQRAAGLEAMSGLSGPWRASGHETVAGIDGVLLVRDEGVVPGTRTEMVIAARAPGVLRNSSVLVDPEEAAASDEDDRGKGLPVGTLIFDERVTVVAAVPDTETVP